MGFTSRPGRGSRAWPTVAALATLLLGASASTASADSDISTGMAWASGPGQGVSISGMAVTNHGPDPAAGVTLAGTVPDADNEGHPVDWQIFTNSGPTSQPFGSFVTATELTGPPFGVDACTFTSSTDYRCDIGPLAVGETRTVIFNPTWQEPNTATTFTQWQGFSYTADLVGGTDPDPSNNDDEFNFVNNGFYYAPTSSGMASDLQVVEQAPPASGAYAPGQAVALAVTATVPDGLMGAAFSVIVPDPDAVTCSGDGVCLTGGPRAVTGPPRVLVALGGARAPGTIWAERTPDGEPYVFETVVTAPLPTEPPAGCAPGKTVPYTFDTTLQPVAGGSTLLSTGIIELPVTVQIACPTPAEPPVGDPPAPPTPPAPPAGPSPVPVAAVTAPKLTLRKTANRTRVKPGQTIRYRLTARNTGRGAAEHVELCDDLPDHLTLVTSRKQLTKAKARMTRGKLCWTLGTLDPGERVVRSFTVRVDRDTRPDRIVNRATVDRTKVTGTDATARRTVTVTRVKPRVSTSKVTG
jgi:uncharacterized repeat protein (TIGR01451 family)